jgi:hypothetical protein
MLLMIVCVRWHNANAQEAGLEQYYSVQGKTMSFTPIVWYQAKTGWYAEARYNYEAVNSISVYTGKTIERRSKLSYSLNTIAGIVMGGFKGGSIAVNADAEYKKIFFSLQSQYTFSVENRSLNYIYIWSDICYQLFPSLSAGISLQQTNGNNTEVISEKGIFVKAGSGKWNVPLYIFNPFNNNRYMVLGINYTWEK